MDFFWGKKKSKNGTLFSFTYFIHLEQAHLVLNTWDVYRRLTPSNFGTLARNSIIINEP